MQELFWRLTYANGIMETEPIPDGASIVTAPKGAISLTLVDETSRPRYGYLDLQGNKPIFYRVRSMGLDLKGARTDAIVFGYGWENDNRIEGTLWTVFDNKRTSAITPCPPELFDQTALELQVTS